MTLFIYLYQALENLTRESNIEPLSAKLLKKIEMCQTMQNGVV